MFNSKKQEINTQQSYGAATQRQFLVEISGINAE